jgi:hypothetical protein
MPDGKAIRQHIDAVEHDLDWYPSSCCGHFRPCRVYIETSDTFRRRFLSVLVSFLGGSVSTDFGDRTITHVACDDSLSPTAIVDLKTQLFADGAYRRFVCTKWIQESFASRSCLGEENFLI